MAERLRTQMARKGITGEEIEQRRRFYARFIKTTGVTDIRELNQSHLAHYVELLHQIPRYYHRSAALLHNSGLAQTPP